MNLSRLALAASIAAVPAYAQNDAGAGDYVVQGERNTSFEPAFDAQFRAPAMSSDFELETASVAGPLEHPWGIEALPEGGYLVTERPGRLRHVTEDGTISDPIDGVPEVVAQEQGGLLDVALGPDFESDRTIYLTYAKPVGDGLSATAAARAVLSEDLTALSDVEDIFVQEPGSTVPMHFGSRILFDDAGHAFVTTGEHFTERYRDYAQDLDKTYGKVIRVGLDGSVPDDNPFVGEENAIASIWSLGHRNIQSAAIGPDGRLWTIEHGPEGGDELNQPEARLNYGWPVVSYGRNYDGSPVGSGEASAEGFEQPVYFWDPVIAPSGMAFYEGEMFAEWDGDILAGSLYPGGVVRLRLEDDRVSGEARLLRDIGRVRDIEVLADGSFVLITDEANGEVVRVTRSGQTN
jgi:glucose/arabinose dehydrogenase